jgi:putative transposase
MRQSRFTETEIVYAVKQRELGIPVREIARKYGVSEKTVYLWRRKYNGVSPSELKRLKELERGNSQLKKLVAELSLDKEILQDVLRKSSRACVQAGAVLGDR